MSLLSKIKGFFKRLPAIFPPLAPTIVPNNAHIVAVNPKQKERPTLMFNKQQLIGKVFILGKKALRITESAGIVGYRQANHFKNRPIKQKFKHVYHYSLTPVR